MSSGESKIIGRRIVNAYLSSVISISLVLLLVGVASLLLVNAKGVSNYFKENMKVSVLLVSDASEDDALAYQKKMDELPFIKGSDYISAEQGEQEMKALLGEDFLDVFETSPIPVSIDFTVVADYVSADSLEVVKTALQKSNIVDEVSYQRSLVDTLNANLSKISIFLAVFIVLLLFISFVLINNTVRLNVYARRFTIHTMRLVGATRAFIRAPFMQQAAFQGVIAALIAIILLLAGLFVMRNEFSQMFEIFSLDLLLIVMGIVLAAGLIICLVSTYFVVNKLVSLKKDELYY